MVINHNLMATRTANALNHTYGNLATSTQRLSTGLRINSAADDAAGLAIRELQRAEISALHQGARNANDAISMIQVADGALAVIDEKLIRMKELAEQAATGTYDSTQRLMIASEFQQMALEIERIANATDFNGIKLLDGSLHGEHDGSKLTSTGAMKVHFGTGNDSAEDYYYVDGGDATLEGLGLKTKNKTKYLSEILQNGIEEQNVVSGVVSLAVIPAGSKDLSIKMYSGGWDDDIQIFTKDGKHIIGTTVDGDHAWSGCNVYNIDDINNKVITEENGFNKNAVYSKDNLNNIGANVTFNDTYPYNEFSFNGMNIKFSGDGNLTNTLTDPALVYEYLDIDYVAEDLVMVVVGGPPSNSRFHITASWSFMKTGSETDGIESIDTQEKAQQMLVKIDRAIEKKDNIRAHLGAMQNRLENTITNLNTQAENLQASESRISDVDVATEMTNFVRNQILTQSAVAMLSQANSLPQMAMQLIGG